MILGRLNLLTTLNKWMEKIPSEGKDEFSYGYHRTSSEYNTNKSAHYVLSSNYITFMTSDKTLDNILYAPFLPSDGTPKPYSQMAAIGNMVAVFL